jgi:hypothetical protein
MSVIFHVRAQATRLALCCLLTVSGSAQAIDLFEDVPDPQNTSQAKSSRMVFNEVSKSNLKSCNLTLMHVYTSKFKKRYREFVFTGSLTAKRGKDKVLKVSVVGDNHIYSPSAKDYETAPLLHVELGVEGASVRNLVDKKASCNKKHTCVNYKENKKKALQGWIADEQRNLSILFGMARKEPKVVIDLSKFPIPPKASSSALLQFKSCVAALN